MDPKDLDHLRKVDAVNSAITLLFLIAGGIALILGASHLGEQFGVHGLGEFAAAGACWLAAWHFKQLGRLY